MMPTAFYYLLFLFFLGLLALAGLGAARTGTARRVIFWLSLALINLGVLLVLLAVFLVSRLEGSTPPGLGEVLAPFWLPVLLIVLVDAALVFINRRVKARIEG